MDYKHSYSVHENAQMLPPQDAAWKARRCSCCPKRPQPQRWARNGYAMFWIPAPLAAAMPRAVLLLAAVTRALAQTGTPGLATYATTLGPSPSFVDPYKSASYAGGVANAAIKTGLAGKTFRVAASYYDLSAGATGGTYEVDALSWVTPSPAALTAFAALPVGSALLLNKSDVTGTGPCLLNRRSTVGPARPGRPAGGSRAPCCAAG
jgi:hypothetical protein